MIIAIREDYNKFSVKGYYIIQLFHNNSNELFLKIFKNNVFKEKWVENAVYLKPSAFGYFLDFLFFVINSPEKFTEVFFRRLRHRSLRNLPVNDGFFGPLSAVSQALSLYFAKPGQTSRLMSFLKKSNCRKIFLIDEFVSLNLVNLQKLKELGDVIYISQDLGYNHFSFASSQIASNLMYQFERRAIPLMDIVIACSESERLKYVEMGAKKTLSYPNIYPNTRFEPLEKDEIPSVSIVLPKHWGSRVDRSLDEVFKALSYIDKRIRVYMVGVKPREVPSNVEIRYFEYIPNKIDYLKLLSRSWIAINIGVHKGGTNEKKYDYAVTGDIVFSDVLGPRGDFLPCEYVYLDYYDLASKLKEIFEFGKDRVIAMGKENRKQALKLADKQGQELIKIIRNSLNNEI